jgi:ABC-type antimicrobial peptide transport system permease subunit
MCEATVLVAIGGAAGSGLGIVVCSVLNALQVKTIPSIGAVVGAFGCSLLVGLASSVVPAMKASGLDPVVALTVE